MAENQKCKEILEHTEQMWRGLEHAQRSLQPKNQRKKKSFSQNPEENQSGVKFINSKYKSWRNIRAIIKSLRAAEQSVFFPFH